MKYLNALLLPIITLLLFILAIVGQPEHKELEYYYCNCSAFGEVTLLIKASDIEDANKQLNAFKAFTHSEQYTSYCSKVSN